MTIVVNEERAATVVKRVERAYIEGWGLLRSRDDLVENQLPAGIRPLSEEHARFLFFTIPNDHGVRSRNLYSRAKELFREMPALFAPRAVLLTYRGPDDVRLAEDAIRHLAVRFPREAARSWYLNAARLVDCFGGSALELFTSFTEAPVLYRTIRTFRGYGPKTGGMLLRAIVGLGFTALERVEEVPIPVDVHDVRIAFLTGAVARPTESVPEDDYHVYAKEVQRALSAVCRRAGVQWPDVDRALWLVGSRGCTKRLCWECPLADICAVGSTIVASRD